VFQKGFKATLGGFGRLFSGFARKGMAKMGHIPPQEKVRQLKELGTHFYLCGPSMQVFKVNKNDVIFDDVIIAEYLTFMEVIKNADIQMFTQECIKKIRGTFSEANMYFNC
jgi:predicted peroxiredoxin